MMNRRTFLTGAAALAAAGLAPASAHAAGGRTLVAYFSCTGNTRAVAERIAELTGGDLFEIVPAQPYTAEDLNYNNKGCRANLEMKDPASRPAIAGPLPGIGDYGTIYLGYPNWWGTMPRIINTFLESHDFGGKVIRPFCTSGGSGVEKSVADIRKAVPAARVGDGLLIPGSAARRSSDRIAGWVGKHQDR